MICPQHRAIFIHIQKTGGDAVTAALGMASAEPTKHWRAVELKGACDETTWREYYKFSIVRNPWARLVSWYAMIAGYREAFQAGKTMNRFQTMVLTRAETFEDFLLTMDEDIIDSDGSKWIYRNQIDYLTDENGALLVDYIARTETLDRDFALIRQRLTGSVGPLRRVNVSRHGHYTEYYTPELARLVADRYARDIDHFQYKFGS